MKNIQRALSKGYFDLLNGMDIGTILVPMHYLKAPYPATGPYILVNGIHAPGNKNMRDGFGTETTVDVTIYTEAKGDYSVLDLGDLIYDEFILRLIPKPGETNVLAEGFNVTYARLVRSTDAIVDQKGKVTFEKRLTIEHLIYQL